MQMFALNVSVNSPYFLGGGKHLCFLSMWKNFQDTESYSKFLKVVEIYWNFLQIIQRFGAENFFESQKVIRIFLTVFWNLFSTIYNLFWLNNNLLFTKFFFLKFDFWFFWKNFPQNLKNLEFKLKMRFWWLIFVALFSIFCALIFYFILRRCRGQSSPGIFSRIPGFGRQYQEQNVSYAGQPPVVYSQYPPQQNPQPPPYYPSSPYQPTPPYHPSAQHPQPQVGWSPNLYEKY